MIVIRFGGRAHRYRVPDFTRDARANGRRGAADNERATIA